MHRLSIHLIPYTYYPLTSLILSAQYIWFDLLSLQTKNYENAICCFAAIYPTGRS